MFFAVWRDKVIMLTIIRKNAPNVAMIPAINHLSFIEDSLLRTAAGHLHATVPMAYAVP